MSLVAENGTSFSNALRLGELNAGITQGQIIIQLTEEITQMGTDHETAQ